MQAISAALFPHLVFLWCTRLLWDSLKVNYISSFVLLHSLQETADQARTRKLMRSNNMRKIMKKKEMRKRKRKKMKMKMKTKKKNDQSYCDLVLLSFYCNSDLILFEWQFSLQFKFSVINTLLEPILFKGSSVYYSHIPSTLVFFIFTGVLYFL